MTNQVCTTSLQELFRTEPSFDVLYNLKSVHELKESFSKSDQLAYRALGCLLALAEECTSNLFLISSYQSMLSFLDSTCLENLQDVEQRKRGVSDEINLTVDSKIDCIAQARSNYTDICRQIFFEKFSSKLNSCESFDNWCDELYKKYDQSHAMTIEYGICSVYFVFRKLADENVKFETLPSRLFDELQSAINNLFCRLVYLLSDRKIRLLPDDSVFFCTWSFAEFELFKSKLEMWLVSY